MMTIGNVLNRLFGDWVDYKQCSECEGAGFVICTVDHDGRYDDYPGTREGQLGDEEDYRKIWRTTCKTCRGIGVYHYNDDGLLIPGRGDEFDQPAPIGKVDYKTYMQSREWRDRANIVKAHAGWRCRICNRHENEVTLDAHHNTYERLGHERLSDLICLCRDCHKIADVRRAAQARQNRGQL